MDTEGVLKLDKCPQCGLLFPVGSEHVCEGEPMQPKSNKRALILGLVFLSLVLAAYVYWQHDIEAYFINLDHLGQSLRAWGN